MFKVITTAAALVLAANTAYAKCSPSDIVGQWQIQGEYDFHFRSRDGWPSRIDIRGNWTGSVHVQDGLGLLFDVRSITPIKVDANCNVTGEFGIFYGGPPALRSYAFRGFMDDSKNSIGYQAMVWPGYDQTPVHARWIRIELRRFRP